MIDGAWSNPSTRNVLCVSPTGSGKCHGVNTPILMFDGTVKMVQDVKIGDQLMGDDSTPRTVLSLARGRENLYRIRPVKGDPYVVNESHILSLKQTGDKGKIKGTIVNIPLKDYINQSKWFKHIHKGWRTGVDFPTKELPENLPPYLLGVWLGDGSSRSSSITNMDAEIVEYIYKYADDRGYNVRVTDQKTTECKTYHVSNGYNNSEGFQPELRNFNLIQNKHIPHDYLVNDRENRLELLAGILDSDGYLSGTSCYDMVFKNGRLAKDVAYLCRSLGFACYLKPCSKKCHNNGKRGIYYRLSLSGDVSQIPTKLARHQPEPRQQKKDHLVTGIKVEPLGEGDYYGFEITGNHLYLLGDFTVTHNTILMAEYAKRSYYHQQPAVLLAHRDELIGQISNALCMMGVKHTFIASNKAVKRITNANHTNHGDSFYDPVSPIIISSVPTLAKRVEKPELQPLLKSIRLWVLDEAHHYLEGGMWCNAISPMINAFGLGVTATPLRSDGKGLGRHADGTFDDLLVVTDYHTLINDGKLSPYKVYTPPVLVDTSDMRAGSNGDFNQRELAKRTDKAEITGDAVEHYKRLLDGKRVITFTVNIEHAKHVADQFNQAGISSKAVSSKTPDDEREQAIEDFKAGRILNLVNCDLFGEGFDVPATEGVIMLRKTESYSLYKQQFGRALRICEGKEYGIIVDHVGNTARMMEKYELRYPHDDPEWSLDRETKRKKNDDGKKLPDTARCPECAFFYLVVNGDKTCPDCGHTETQEQKEQAQRELQVKEGVLVELSVDIIDNLIAKRAEIDVPVPEFARRMQTAPSVVRNSAINKHAKRQHAQIQLRREIQNWCTQYGSDTGYTVPTVQAEFERVFGINIFKAQTLSERESMELLNAIRL